MILIKMLQSIPTIAGKDGNNYDLKEGDIRFVPKVNAEALILRNIAELQETEYLRICDKEKFETELDELKKENRGHLVRWIDDSTIIVGKKDAIVSLIMHQLKKEKICITLDLVEDALQGISRFNESTLIDVENTVAEYAGLVKKQDSNAIHFKKEYSVHMGRVSSSKSDFPIGIVHKGETPYKTGTRRLYLQEISEETRKLLLTKPVTETRTFNKVGFEVVLKSYGIFSKYHDGGIDYTKEPMALWEEFIPMCYEETLPIPEDELKRCKNLDAVLELAINGGMTLDNQIFMLMASQVPCVDVDLIKRPNRYMPYSPNAICSTGTKTGKSTTANRISPTMTVREPTVAGLMGFSTADKKHIGLLHGESNTLFVDEMTESKDREAADGLGSYMESGEDNRPRGQGIEVKGCSPIVFMSNPKTMDKNVSDIDIYETFNKTLEYITGNTIAMGSRIGILIFNSTLNKAHGKRTSHVIDEKALTVLRAAQEYTKKEFTELFSIEKVTNWLDLPYEDDYKKELVRISESIPIDRIREFIRSHGDSYRHVRGVALHLAFYYNMGRIIRGDKPNIDDFLNECDEQFKAICNINMNSIYKIASVEIDGEIIESRIIESPTYIKYLLQSLNNYFDDFKDFDEMPNRILFDDLRDSYNMIEGRERNFRNFGSFKQMILKKNINNLDMMLNNFGYSIMEVNTLMIKVNNDTMRHISANTINTLKNNFGYLWILEKQKRLKGSIQSIQSIHFSEGECETIKIKNFNKDNGNNGDGNNSGYSGYFGYSTSTDDDNIVSNEYPEYPMNNNVELIKQIKKFAKRSDQKENTMQRNYRSFVYGFAATLSGFPDIEELMSLVQRLAERGEL